MFDVSVESLVGGQDVHTSDRILFKRCRRKWDFQSPLRQNLSPIDGNSIHLWFGSGCHFALEDCHGYNTYKDPRRAFRAYYDATRRHHPEGAEEHLILAYRMFEHYIRWGRRRKEFRTFWQNGIPQVEVNWKIPLWNDLYYEGTFDRIVVDAYERYWILDYKTAQRFDTSKLDTDPQVNAYCWAFERLYGQPPEGMVYVQLKKAAPNLPIQLQDGSLSVNKSQATTYDLFRAAALTLSPDPDNWPEKYHTFLAYMAEQDTPEGDAFIRRDMLRRNAAVVGTEWMKIQAEVTDMTNPNLPLYPNPTRDCVWDCSFKPVCLAMDDGSDWEYLLKENYQRREVIGSWRSNLPTPESMPPLKELLYLGTSPLPSLEPELLPQLQPPSQHL